MLETVGTPLLWAAFGVFVVAMLALDLGVFHRGRHEISVRDATVWSAIWIALALAFNGWVFWRFGAEAGEAFLTGYLIEKSLSVDNLFVFYVLFQAFRVEPRDQHRLLFWGVLGALVLRGLMVWGGAVLLATFHDVIYVFGAILILTGIKMFVRRESAPDPTRSRLYRAATRHVPASAAVLVTIELTDLVFALDSILAIFAISTDPFIVFTSNVFAVMGLRSLYFVLAGLARRFDYLQPGLALVMIFVGVKMAASEHVHVPVVVSLGVVVLLLGGSVVASIIRARA